MREYMELAEPTALTIKFGTIYVKAIDGNTIYVDASSNGKFLTVSGKEYSFNVRLGAAQLEAYEVYGSPKNSFHIWDKIPKTYQAKILAEVVSAVKKWLAENPDTLAHAKQADTNNRARSLEQDIAELEDKLAEKRAELAKVLAP